MVTRGTHHNQRHLHFTKSFTKLLPHKQCLCLPHGYHMVDICMCIYSGGTKVYVRLYFVTFQNVYFNEDLMVFLGQPYISGSE